MVNLRAKEAERAAQMFKRQKADGGDKEDMFFDNKEYASTNKQVANILGEEAAKPSTETKEEAPEATIEQLEGAQWGDEDEIDIDMGDDLVPDGEQPAGQSLAMEEDSDIFVPPNQGSDPIS